MDSIIITHRDHSTSSADTTTNSTARSSRIRRKRQKDGSYRREGHLVSLMGTAWEGTVYASDVYIAAGQYLAWKHIQERSGEVLPHLPALLEGTCDDFDWTYEQRETYYSPTHAVQELVDATTDRRFKMKTKKQQQEPQRQLSKVTTNRESSSLGEDRELLTLDIISGGDNTATTTSTSTSTSGATTNYDEKTWQHPFALVGAAYSYVTLPLTIVGSALELPLMSGSATSGAFDEQPTLPFGRTIPTNAGDARAAILYYKSIGVTHLVSLYIRDAWGEYYNADLKREANREQITLYSVPYLEHDIESAMLQLKKSHYRYVFAIMYNWKSVLEAAYDCQVIGTPEYSWIAAELIEWTDPEFALNRTSYDDDDDPDEHDVIEYKWSRALNGIGQLVLDVPTHERFSTAMEDLAASPTLLQDFLDTHADPDLWSGEDMEWTVPDSSFYQQMNYDAVIALGLAACHTPGLFTGPEFYDTLRSLTFEGTTGNVSFDPTTGSRSVDSVQYRVDSIYLSEERSDEDTLRFESNLVALVRQGQVHHLLPFVYADNTTTMPPVLPPMEYEYNLVPVGAHVFGWIVAGLVMLVSLTCLLWTYLNRTKFVVQASQPIFLIQLCVGTLVMAAAVIPMSFQATDEALEDSPGLSRRLGIACMSVPWLVVLGLVVALSALSSKAWRLNQLMKAGMQMRRIEVQPSDVMGPFAVLMSINVAMLIGWTIVAPLEYVRVPENNVDIFGRDVESYGTCQSQKSNSLYFFIPMVVANFGGLSVATYQSYQGRNYATAISESRYLAMSMASLLESLLLGGPILLVLQDNPTGSYVMRSTLLCITCMTILLPVFVPKYYYHKARTGGSTSTAFQIRGSNHRAGASSDDLGGSKGNAAGAGAGAASPVKPEWGKMSVRRLENGMDQSSSARHVRHARSSERQTPSAVRLSMDPTQATPPNGSSVAANSSEQKRSGTSSYGNVLHT